MNQQPYRLSDELQDIAFRVLALIPDHRDPEKYHDRKSEIVGRLKALAHATEHGRGH